MPLLRCVLILSLGLVFGFGALYFDCVGYDLRVVCFDCASDLFGLCSIVACGA